jgi:hypothetical protein
MDTLAHDLTIDGLTGDPDADYLLIREVPTRYLTARLTAAATNAGAVDSEAVAEYERKLFTSWALSDHNRARPLIATERHAWAELTRQRQRVTHAYGYLAETSTARWAAAHHRWISAAHDLADAVEAWAAAAGPAADAVETLLRTDRAHVYAKVIPAEQRLPLDIPDVAAVREEITAEHERRLRIAATTLRHLAAVSPTTSP